MSNSRNNFQFLNNPLAIRQEIQRFESVHPSIYAIYDLIELIADQQIAQQVRDHVVCIEGKKKILLYSNSNEKLRLQQPFGGEWDMSVWKCVLSCVNLFTTVNIRACVCMQVLTALSVFIAFSLSFFFIFALCCAFIARVHRFVCQ